MIDNWRPCTCFIFQWSYAWLGRPLLEVVRNTLNNAKSDSIKTKIENKLHENNKRLIASTTCSLTKVFKALTSLRYRDETYLSWDRALAYSRCHDQKKSIDY